MHTSISWLHPPGCRRHFRPGVDAKKRQKWFTLRTLPSHRSGFLEKGIREPSRWKQCNHVSFTFWSAVRSVERQLQGSSRRQPGHVSAWIVQQLRKTPLMVRCGATFLRLLLDLSKYVSIAHSSWVWWKWVFESAMGCEATSPVRTGALAPDCFGMSCCQRVPFWVVFKGHLKWVFH